MRRASFLLSPLRKNRGRADLMERARSPFGAPPRHPRFFRPRLGSGRASWNHRMQTGGPSPAPVQRAPRSPARAGRDDAQAARERSVSLRPTRTAPAPPQGVPSRKASLYERDFGYVTVLGTDVKGNVALFGTPRRADLRCVISHPTGREAADYAFG